jgi:predicted MPP superfamily phosphohydrolase
MSVRQQYISFLVLGLLAVFLGTLAWQDASNAWPTNEEKTLLKTFLFYESWLMFLFIPLVIWGFKHKQVSMGFFLISVIGMVFGIYARFIEPNLLFVKHTSIQTGYTLKLALISDMHYGLYSTPQQMRRLVNKLNTLEVDAVVVAGDWTYEPSQKISLIEQLKPFRQLKHPIYSVPSNHDEEMPGPPLAKELKAALISNNIKPIEGQSIDLGKVRLVGVGDLLAFEARAERLAVLSIQDKPLLLLTHNPDSLYELPKLTQPFVMLAGHTHGGQINLPILTEKILALITREGYQRGLYPLADRNQLFVTSGIGMIGLPLRFAMPPVIDVLTFE